MRYLVLVLLFAGCTSVPPAPVLMGGSRADAVVEIGYDFGVFASPNKEAQKAAEESLTEIALQACTGWEYQTAVQMGPPRRACAYELQEGAKCYKYTQLYKFQCGS